MTNPTDTTYLKALGARILGQANDLKRTPGALARELDLDAALVDAVIEGTADVATARRVVEAMSNTYPLSKNDVWVEPDDTDHGVRLMTSADSKDSRRIFDRAGRGGVTPYYEYRDTAMSRTAPFRPEWIAQLRVVDDSDPDNPDVAYNNGHLMHQTTFFIGPVNFYWAVRGRRFCAELDTGDSNYITPFVPHSFTSREPDHRGLIIAVTYAGQLRSAATELGNIGIEAATDLAGDLREADAFARRLKRHLAADALDEDGFVRRLAENGVAASRGRALLDGVEPRQAEIVAAAEVLNIRPADLMISPLSGEEEVVVRRRAEVVPREYPAGNAPAYRLIELARSRHQPLLKGFDVTVLGDAGGDMRHSLHQYVYNYGSTPVRLVWSETHRETLGPGDSAYVQPMVRHRFERPADADPGQLVMIRVPGALTDAVLDELATFAPAGRARAIRETEQWF